AHTTVDYRVHLSLYSSCLGTVTEEHARSKAQRPNQRSNQKALSCTSTRRVFNRILRSSQTLQAATYSKSDCNRSIKSRSHSVAPRYPLTCANPVSPGFSAWRFQ